MNAVYCARWGHWYVWFRGAKVCESCGKVQGDTQEARE